MKRALLIASLCMVSCSPSRVLVQSRQTDSVRIDEKIRIRTQIKYVPVIVHIPDQQTSVIAEPSDTSHLETKYADYGKVTGMLMLFDLLAILFGIYSLPYASGVAAVGVVYTEYRSVRENLKAIKSSAVEMTTIVELLAKAKDPKKITELLLQYNEVKNNASRQQPKNNDTK